MPELEFDTWTDSPMLMVVEDMTKSILRHAAARAPERFEVLVSPCPQGIRFQVPALRPGDPPVITSQAFGAGTRASVLEYRKRLGLDVKSEVSFNVDYYYRWLILNITAFNNPDSTISLTGTLERKSITLRSW